MQAWAWGKVQALPQRRMHKNLAKCKCGGVCIRHGAKVKRCSSEGCTSVARGREECADRSDDSAIKGVLIKSLSSSIEYIPQLPQGTQTQGLIYNAGGQEPPAWIAIWEIVITPH